MRHFIAIILLSVLWQVHAAEFSSAEQKSIEIAADNFNTTCKIEMKAVLLQMEDKKIPRSYANWAKILIDPLDYCSCGESKIRKLLTPEFIRSGDFQKGYASGLLIGAQCVLPKLKTSFPEFCQNFTAELMPHSRREGQSPADVLQFCACLQTNVDRITEQDIAELAKAGNREVVASQASQEFMQKSLAALMKNMQRCGIVDLREKYLRP